MSASGWQDVELRDPSEVPAALARIGRGLSVELLLNAGRRGQSAADFVTKSYPIWYEGAVRYAETNAGVREALGGLGWTFRDDKNIPMVLSPDSGHAITAIHGNIHTGLRSRGVVPQTSRPRSAAGIRIIQLNAQLTLWGDDNPPADAEDFQPARPTWFFLYFRAGDTLRSELSLAEAVSSTGMLLKWKERLVLPEIDLLPPKPSVGTDTPPPNLDVQVTRLAS